MISVSSGREWRWSTFGIEHRISVELFFRKTWVFGRFLFGDFPRNPAFGESIEIINWLLPELGVVALGRTEEAEILWWHHNRPSAFTHRGIWRVAYASLTDFPQNGEIWRGWRALFFRFLHSRGMVSNTMRGLCFRGFSRCRESLPPGIRRGSFRLRKANGLKQYWAFEKIQDANGDETP